MGSRIPFALLAIALSFVPVRAVRAADPPNSFLGLRTARSGLVMHESEGSADELGGDPKRPAICGRARVADPNALWNFGGVGPAAMRVACLQGADWFLAVRPKAAPVAP